MGVAIVSGSNGLIGAQAVRFLAAQGLEVAGIDNDLRSHFFGSQGSTLWQREELQKQIPQYRHYDLDIRDAQGLERIFGRYGSDISLVLHCAAQPSHDWAARDPQMDFTINANGTLNLLEAFKRHCPRAVFIFTSTNKVYGDRPNSLPLVELESRYELDASHPYAEKGIDESMPLDQCMHSLFGASKVAADVIVQEYGRYFGLNTACFRGGCLTGGSHSAAELHGFLAYLMRCALTDTPYTIFGYKGKQVRDNIHASDLIKAFWCYFQDPDPGAVYNIGGGRHANCSILEAAALVEELTGRPMQRTYSEQNRMGDHIWWISDVSRFQKRYPQWRYEYDLMATLREIQKSLSLRLSA